MVKENGMIMLSEKEYELTMKEKNFKIEELEKSNEMLRKAILQLTNKSNTTDVRVSKKDFLKIYNKALDYMFEHPEIEENDIYGYDFTVHWHGIFCNCSDGATAYNNLIPAIEGCDSEVGEED